MKDILKTEDDKELDFDVFHNDEDYCFNDKNDSAFRKCQKVDGHLDRINSLSCPIKPYASDRDIVDDVQKCYQCNVLRINITQF